MAVFPPVRDADPGQNPIAFRSLHGGEQASDQERAAIRTCSREDDSVDHERNGDDRDGNSSDRHPVAPLRGFVPLLPLVECRMDARPYTTARMASGQMSTDAIASESEATASLQ